MSNEILWLTEKDVVGMLHLPEATEVLQRSFVMEHGGQARNMAKTMVQYGRSNLHALGGQLADVVGAKCWTHAEAGTCPMLLLWDAHDGHLIAVIEAFALGNLRTGGTSALATQWLARPDASTMAIMGCGKQALPQVAAVVAVRPINLVRVYGRTPEVARRFAKQVSEQLGISALACHSVEEAAAGADVITTVTRASEPFVFGGYLKEGAHLNAIGAIGLDREEFAQDVFDRAHTVCVDHLSGVQQLSREFGLQYATRGWDSVCTLGRIVAEGRQRWQPAGLTLFKAMGMGLSDVALGTAVLEHARRTGVGRLLPQPRKAALDFEGMAQATRRP